MKRVRRLPEWYEEALLVDESELVRPLGIRVRTMATLPIHVEYFIASYPGSLPLWTVELCRFLAAEIPEAAKEVPARWWWKTRREFDMERSGCFVGPTAVCRTANDGQPELVIALRTRDPWRALY